MNNTCTTNPTYVQPPTDLTARSLNKLRVAINELITQSAHLHNAVALLEVQVSMLRHELALQREAREEGHAPDTTCH